MLRVASSAQDNHAANQESQQQTSLLPKTLAWAEERESQLLGSMACRLLFRMVLDGETLQSVRLPRSSNSRSLYQNEVAPQDEVEAVVADVVVVEEAASSESAFRICVPKVSPALQPRSLKMTKRMTFPVPKVAGRLFLHTLKTRTSAGRKARLATTLLLQMNNHLKSKVISTAREALALTVLL